MITKKACCLERGFLSLLLLFRQTVKLQYSGAEQWLCCGHSTAPNAEKILCVPMPRMELGCTGIRDLFIYSELWKIKTKLGLHSHKNRLCHRISPDVIRVSGHPHSVTQAFSIGAARFGSSKVHKEHSLYELVHHQSHPKLRG